jgi:hypothetical protein
MGLPELLGLEMKGEEQDGYSPSEQREYAFL